jgi:hypothetical protein
MFDSEVDVAAPPSAYSSASYRSTASQGFLTQSYRSSVCPSFSLVLSPAQRPANPPVIQAYSRQRLPAINTGAQCLIRETTRV